MLLPWWRALRGHFPEHRRQDPKGPASAHRAPVCHIDYSGDRGQSREAGGEGRRFFLGAHDRLMVRRFFNRRRDFQPHAWRPIVVHSRRAALLRDGAVRQGKRTAELTHRESTRLELDDRSELGRTQSGIGHGRRDSCVAKQRPRFSWSVPTLPINSCNACGRKIPIC